MHKLRECHQFRGSHEISAANARIMAAFRNGDAAAVAALYAHDAAMVPASAPFIAPRPAIERFWQSVLDLGGVELSLITIELQPAGPHVCEIGQFKVLGPTGTRRALGVGRYLTLWHLEHGQWLIHRQIWNCRA